MVDEEALNEKERRMWEYIQKTELEERPWKTPEVARDLDLTEDEAYETLSGLGRKLKEEMYIYYKDGYIRVALNEARLSKK